MSVPNNEWLFGIEFLNKIIEWLQERMRPEEVFTEQQLDAWACNHGYRKGRIQDDQS